MSIEIELRGIITKDLYNETVSFLDENADTKEVDNLLADFFILPDLNLKIANHTSQNYAKVVLKMGKISTTSNKEIEVRIKSEECEKMKEIFVRLGFDHVVPTDQKRINYSYNGCLISMKWSSGWSYHFEIEKCVELESEVQKAEEEIRKVLSSLNLTPMSKEEIKSHCLKITGKK